MVVSGDDSPDLALVAPPTSLGPRRLRRTPAGFELESRFPVWPHVYQVLTSGLSLGTGLLMLALAAQLLRPELAALSGRLPLTVVALLFACVFLRSGWLGWRELASVRLSASGEELILSGPRPAGLVRDGLAERKRMSVAFRLATLTDIRLGDEGLLLETETRSLFVPEAYRTAVGGRAGVRFELDFPSFEPAELAWLGALLRRARNVGQTPPDLQGWATPGELEVASQPTPRHLQIRVSSVRAATLVIALTPVCTVLARLWLGRG